MATPDHQAEQRQHHQAHAQFVVGRQQDGGDQADRDAAQGAAQRQHQVEARQVPGRGPAARHLAVQHHAPEEQAAHIQRQRGLQALAETRLQPVGGQRQQHAPHPAGTARAGTSGRSRR